MSRSASHGIRKPSSARSSKPSRAPEVRECHNVTGSIEYLLRVEAADIAAYKRFHTDVLGALPQVWTIMSYIVLETPKDERR
jgi:DNA-binding Lrp family transcriptional regulator